MQIHKPMLSITRSFFITCLLVLGVFNQSTAQEQDNDPVLNDSTSEDEGRRIFAFDWYLQQPIPTGDSFVGSNFTGRLGFGTGLQFYPYKNVYLGGALNFDYFKNDNPLDTGTYDRSHRFNAYFFAGYEFVFHNKIRVGVDVGYGYTQFRNRQSPEQGNGVFRDSGSLLKFRSALEYHFADSFSMVLSPSFEQGFYDIKASPNLIENFETASFFTLSLGVRYHVDNLSNAQRSRQIITEDQELKDLLSRDHDDLSISEKRRKYFLLKKQKRINRRNARRSNLP